MAKSKVGTGRTALITGASSGIGEAMAANFARGGFDLVLVARTAEKLRTLADELSERHGVKTSIAPADLSKRGSAKKLAASMKREGRAIDVLVNSAGVLQHGAFVPMPEARDQEMIDLNVSGLTSML